MTVVAKTKDHRTLFLSSVLILAGSCIPCASAQTTSAPGSAPPAAASRTFSSEQLGAVSSPQRFMITSGANDKGAFLWIVDSVERIVTLCEKLGTAADFACSKKTLP